MVNLNVLHLYIVMVHARAVFALICCLTYIEIILIKYIVLQCHILFVGRHRPQDEARKVIVRDIQYPILYEIFGHSSHVEILDISVHLLRNVLRSPDRNIGHYDQVGSLHDLGGHLLALINPWQLPDDDQ